MKNFVKKISSHTYINDSYIFSATSKFESFVFSMHLMFVHLTAMTLHRVLSEIKDKNDYSAPEKNFFISIEVL